MKDYNRYVKCQKEIAFYLLIFTYPLPSLFLTLYIDITLRIDFDLQTCGIQSCAILEPGPHFGVIRVDDEGVDGLYCGPGKVNPEKSTLL